MARRPEGGKAPRRALAMHQTIVSLTDARRLDGRDGMGVSEKDKACLPVVEDEQSTNLG